MMKKAHILILLLALLFLAGCKESSMSSSIPQYYAYDDEGEGYDDPGGEMHHIPEPATLALFGSGLLGLVGYALAKLNGRRK